jgi:large subunit ribosomal protein L13
MMKEQKSYHAKPSEIKQEWHVIDAEGVVLGRLATKVANVLRGKHKPTFTPSQDTGDFVVILNAEKVKVTGNKANDKFYHHFSGFPGGLRSTSFKDQVKKDATQVVIAAVKGMLPHTRLSRQVIKKLKVYNGATHPHEAQNPIELKIS